MYKYKTFSFNSFLLQNGYRRLRIGRNSSNSATKSYEKKVEISCTRTKNPNCSKQFAVKQPLGGDLKNRCSKICGQNP